MADAQALFGLLRQTADPAVVEALKTSVETDPDRFLNRINPLTYAQAHGLDEEETIGGFVHGARLGLFDMSWNMLCPGCGGVLEAGAALKTLNHDHYYCSLCTADYEPMLDKLVEVTFTVNPAVRRIAAHEPDSLPFAEYMRQIFWSSSNDTPEDVESAIQKVTLDVMELGASEKAAMSLSLAKGFAIVFDPVTHSSLFLNVDGEETRERRNLSLVFADAHSHNGTQAIQPGPVRISFDNKTVRRTLPGIWIHSEEMDKLTSPRLPFLTATRLLSNQAFRDLYRSGTFDPEQRFKITSLTILFTDLRGLDRALRADRRSRRFRPRAQPLRRAARGGLSRGRRGGQDHRRCGDGDFPHPRPGAAGGDAHARGDARDQPGARRRGPGAQYRAAFGSVPGRHARRPAGLFRPDGQHRLAGE